MSTYARRTLLWLATVSVKSRLAATICILMGGLLLLTTLPAQAAPATFTVNSTADDDDGSCDAAPGDCTLREAINAANNNGNPGDVDIIQFALGTGNPTIDVGATAGPTFGTALPTITQPVLIDGNTGGATRVVLNGSGAGASASGLYISAGNSTVKSLVISSFSGSGILLRSSGNTVEGSIIGVAADGVTPAGNGGSGITIAAAAL
jgi:CSLREA domain-containing protein